MLLFEFIESNFCFDFLFYSFCIFSGIVLYTVCKRSETVFPIDEQWLLWNINSIRRFCWNIDADEWKFDNCKGEVIMFVVGHMGRRHLDIVQSRLGIQFRGACDMVFRATYNCSWLSRPRFVVNVSNLPLMCDMFWLARSIFLYYFIWKCVLAMVLTALLCRLFGCDFLSVYIQHRVQIW